MSTMPITVVANFIGDSGLAPESVRALSRLTTVERLAALLMVVDVAARALAASIESEWDMGLADGSPTADVAVRLVRALGEIIEAMEEVRRQGGKPCDDEAQGAQGGGN